MPDEHGVGTDGAMSDQLAYGGQAVIEGVMMRSPRFFAVACRRPDGTLAIHEEALGSTLLGKLQWLNRPFLRGTLALIDALSLGMKALAYAANVQASADDEKRLAADGRSGKGDRRDGNAIRDIAIGATMVVSLSAGIGLFVILPTLLTQLVQARFGIESSTGRNVVDGAIRMSVFIAYVLLISLMYNIRRVFQYHGAEHKVINTLEEGRELTLESALQSSRIHPRCGTSFVVIVLLATIVVHSLFPRPEHAAVRVTLHLALLPLIAGASYELIRWAGRRRSAWLMHILVAPGMWSQSLTTREPTPDQVEVALAALECVVRCENGPAEASAPV